MSTSGGPARVAVAVPGILGSELEYVDEGQVTELWSANFLKNLSLLADASALLQWKERRATARFIESATVGIPQIQYKLWGATLQRLERSGAFHSVWRCGYDWRESLLGSADAICIELSTRLNAAVDTERRATSPALTFVSHSMGGLVVRVAVGEHRLHPSWIDRLVHIGTPLRGSAAAFRSTFDRAGLPYLNELISTTRAKSKVTALANLQSVFQSFASLYQLIPPHEIPILFYDHQLPRTNPLDETVLAEKNRRLASDAHKALREADRIFEQSSTHVQLIYTNDLPGKPTALEYAVEVVSAPTPRYIVKEVYAQTGHGDGTVSESSASHSAGIVQPFPVIGVEHTYLCNDRRVAEYASMVE